MNDSNECQIKGSIKPIEHEKFKQIFAPNGKLYL